ncbi:MAG: cache domain-containing protein [Thermodesulfobacteriota bacterium]|nr:cache domain-containing protein [Thermodesulfobacteriota bacterium]
MKIASKISISFLIITMALVTVAGSVFYIIAKNNLKNAIFAHLETTAKSRASQIETFLNMRKECIKQLSQGIMFEKFLRPNKQDQYYTDIFNIIEKRLKKTKKACKYFYEIFVLDAKGKVVVSSDRIRIGRDRSTDSYFLKAKSSPYIKDVYFSQTTGEKSMAVSAPVRDSKTKAFLGVVVGRISMKTLNEITGARTGLGKTGELYLINRDGYMITLSCFRKNTFLILNVDNENTRNCLEDFRKFGEAPHLHKAFIYSDYRGVKVLGIHDHIPEMQWGVIAKIDKSEAFAPLNKIKTVFVVILFLVPLTVWLTGSFISRLITKPIEKLREGTEIIGRGDLDYKVGTEAKDEIGQLSRAFDKMTGDLKNTTTSLDELNKEITERKQAEQQLSEHLENLEAIVKERTKELELTLHNTEKERDKIDRMKTELISTAAHELKTPLTSIQGYSELLISRDDIQEKERKEFLTYINERSRHLAAIINDMLYISDSESGTGLQITKQPVDMAELIRESVSTFQERYPDRLFKIDLTEEKDSISLDREKMGQVLENLLSNAVKFSSSNTAVTIRGEKTDKYYEVFIEDEGIGMTAEQADKIFDKLYRADMSSTAVEGVGLGMTIVKYIIEAHNGTIHVKSRHGKGTVVNFLLKI